MAGEDPLVASLPVSICGPVPLESPVHTEICERRAALVQLEAFENTPWPGGEG